MEKRCDEWNTVVYPLIPCPLWSEREIQDIQREFGDKTGTVSLRVGWYAEKVQHSLEVYGCTLREAVVYAVVEGGYHAKFFFVEEERIVVSRESYDPNEVLRQLRGVKRIQEQYGSYRSFVDPLPNKPLVELTD